jgi:tetratricopeptide (TPR) repeat protein
MIAPQRLKLHRQVARSLETLYANSLEGHAAELAEHFSHSTDPADLKKAVEYAEMGAKRATDVYAYGEAVRLLEHALKVQEITDPENRTKRCDMFLALGDALVLAGEHQRVVDAEAPQAFALAEAITDNKRASRACLLAIRGLTAYGVPLMISPGATQWAAQADRYADPNTVERVMADMMLGLVEWSRVSSSPQGIALLTRALDLARRLGDLDTYWWTAAIWLHIAGVPQHDEERLRLAVELSEESRHGVHFVILGWVLWGMVHTFLEFGQRRRAEGIMAELKKLAQRSGQPNLLIVSMIHDSVMAIWDGRLEEAVTIRRHIMARAEELGILEFAGVWTSWLLPARVHLGDGGRALESMLRGARSFPQNIVSDATILYCLAHLGRYAEVREKLDQWVIARPSIGSTEDETTAWVDMVSLEVAVLAGHHQAAELLLRRLAGSGGRTRGFYMPTCTNRHLGGACALLNRPEEARNHYREAISVCTDMKFRPELALTRLQLAELLLEHYPDEKKEALEHLDFAIKEFQDMKMQPSLERALRHKEILKA